MNATSVGMGGDGLPVPVGAARRRPVVADLVYHPLDTPLLGPRQRASALAPSTVSACSSTRRRSPFELWTGVTAPIPKQ